MVIRPIQIPLFETFQSVNQILDIIFLTNQSSNQIFCVNFVKITEFHRSIYMGELQSSSALNSIPAGPFYKNELVWGGQISPPF